MEIKTNKDLACLNADREFSFELDQLELERFRYRRHTGLKKVQQPNSIAKSSLQTSIAGGTSLYNGRGYCLDLANKIPRHFLDGISAFFQMVKEDKIEIEERTNNQFIFLYNGYRVAHMTPLRPDRQVIQRDMEDSVIYFSYEFFKHCSLGGVSGCADALKKEIDTINFNGGLRWIKGGNEIGFLNIFRKFTTANDSDGIQALGVYLSKDIKKAFGSSIKKGDYIKMCPHFLAELKRSRKQLINKIETMGNYEEGISFIDNFLKGAFETKEGITDTLKESIEDEYHTFHFLKKLLNKSSMKYLYRFYVWSATSSNAFFNSHLNYSYHSLSRPKNEILGKIYSQDLLKQGVIYQKLGMDIYLAILNNLHKDKDFFTYGRSFISKDTFDISCYKPISSDDNSRL